MGKYVLYMDENTLITPDYFAQLLGKVIKINNLYIEFDNAYNASVFFNELVEKALAAEQNGEYVYIVKDRLLIAGNKIFELSSNTINSTIGELITQSQYKAQKIFDSLKSTEWSNVISFATGGTTSVSGTCNCITGNDNPTINLNPPTVGTLYINTQTGDIWVCIDNTKDENKWINILTKQVIMPIPEPDWVGKNISAPTRVEISLPSAATIVFYGKGWQSGNYHYLFRTYTESNVWQNDMYYGNGFTVRQNCSFAFSYIQTPPSGDQELVAIAAWDTNGWQLTYFSVDENGKVSRVYDSSGNQKWCGCDYICLYSDDCNSSNYTLGGIIYRAELYSTKINDEDFEALASRIVEKYKEDS